MALKKKNVFQEFLQDDYLPTGDQEVVKYVMGKGNNLHEVQTPEGATFLVSMPKKYRQTVWLKKGDCIVIDPISEGKKVLGEVNCLIPKSRVEELVSSGDWVPKFAESSSRSRGKEEGQGDEGQDAQETLSESEWKEKVLKFFGCKGDAEKELKDEEDRGMFPSSEDEEEEEESCEEDVEDCSEEAEASNSNSQSDLHAKNCTNSSNSVPLTIRQDSENNEGDESYKSRVQFLTSGVVTVTNVVNDMNSLHSGALQSLDFEAEDSSLEQEGAKGFADRNENHNSMRKKANTIRIQVGYERDGEEGYES